MELSDESDEDIDAVERNGLVSQVVLGIAFFLLIFIFFITYQKLQLELF